MSPARKKTKKEPEITPETSHLGTVLAVLIVILVLLLCGLYLWSTVLKSEPQTEAPLANRPTPEENNEPESTRAEAEVMNLGALSTSDEINAIEADLESTDTEGLDTELITIENELRTSLKTPGV